MTSNGSQLPALKGECGGLEGGKGNGIVPT